MSSEVSIDTIDPKTIRTVFYRLYGDIVEQLNIAVQSRVAEGATQASIARRVDQGPAMLSRILSGQSGSNLKSVATVLAATNFRFEVCAVSCEELARRAEERRSAKDGPALISLVSTDGTVWSTPKRHLARRQQIFDAAFYVENNDSVSI